MPDEEKMIYVVGIVFDKPNLVLLILKKRPGWMAGKFNGIGGKVEGDETPLEAMEREAVEEMGVPGMPWRQFLTMRRPDKNAEVHIFTADYEPRYGNVFGRTDEEISWMDVRVTDEQPLMEDLRWLIPMAMDARHPVIDMDIVSSRY